LKFWVKNSKKMLDIRKKICKGVIVLPHGIVTHVGKYPFSRRIERWAVKRNIRVWFTSSRMWIESEPIYFTAETHIAYYDQGSSEEDLIQWFARRRSFSYIELKLINLKHTKKTSSIFFYSAKYSYRIKSI